MAEEASTPEAETEEEHVPVTQTTKEAFAAALERKKQTGQARAAHLDGHGGVGGSRARRR